MQAGPGTPAPELGVISGHAGCQMLEVSNGIPDEKIAFSMGEIPGESGVRGGLIWDHGCFVQLENGLRGFPLKPKGL